VLSVTDSQNSVPWYILNKSLTKHTYTFLSNATMALTFENVSKSLIFFFREYLKSLCYFKSRLRYS
jgi:hypothetical protein